MNKTLKVVFLCAVIGLVSFYFTQNSKEMSQLGDVLSSKNLDLGLDQKYELSRREIDGQGRWFLTKKGTWTNKNIELVGFESDASLCARKIYEINQQKFVCFRGLVGVHSENYVLVSLDKFRPIDFVQSGLIDPNIYSDVPSAGISQNIFLIDQRDYDRDPISDSIRYKFTFDGSAFVFDKKINITYDGENNNFLGDL